MMNQLIYLQVTQGQPKMTTTDHFVWLTCSFRASHIELVGKNEWFFYTSLDFIPFYLHPTSIV